MKNLIFTIASLGLLFACGSDDSVKEEALAFAEPTAEGITLEKASRGVFIHLSEALSANYVGFSEIPTHAGALILYEQIFSESRSLTARPNSRDPNYERCIEEVYDHDRVGETMTMFDRTYFVIDFERLDGEWLVDWEGGARDDPENREESMNFAREEYKEDITERIMDSFTVHDPPDSVIIGHGMERYYQQNPDDWANFVTFVHTLRAEILQSYPETRLSVGINWSNFVDEIAPTFNSQVQTMPDSGRSFEAILLAWEALMLPLYFDEQGTSALDFYAFSAVPSRENIDSDGSVDDQHYLGVPSLLNHQVTQLLPVAWYAVGIPLGVESSRSYNTFLEQFLAANGGYEIEVVSWHGLYHLLPDECDRLQSSERDVGAPSYICNQGMFSMSGGDISDLPQTFFGEEYE